MFLLEDLWRTTFIRTVPTRSASKRLSLQTVRWQSCEHVVQLTGTGRLFYHRVLPKSESWGQRPWTGTRSHGNGTRCLAACNRRRRWHPPSKPSHYCLNWSGTWKRCPTQSPRQSLPHRLRESAPRRFSEDLAGLLVSTHAGPTDVILARCVVVPRRDDWFRAAGPSCNKLWPTSIHRPAAAKGAEPAGVASAKCGCIAGGASLAQ